MKGRVFSGARPTGRQHLGNYLGALIKFVALQDQRPYLFVADLHAITVWQDPAKLAEQTREIAAAYVAAGLDPTKAANWKRLNSMCGEGGALNDLGMHACHIPLRLGWKPSRVFAQLQKGYPQRPDGKGGVTN